MSGFPRPNNLVAPLVLPATTAGPLTTQGGNTLDDGSGIMRLTKHLNVSSEVNAGGAISTGQNGFHGGSNSIIYIDAPGTPGGFVAIDPNTPKVSFGSAGNPAPVTVEGSIAATGALQPNNAAALNSGTGAPTIAGAVGDLFFRTDATTTADERIYICTVAGAAGAATWDGIV